MDQEKVRVVAVEAAKDKPKKTSRAILRKK